MPCDQSRVEPSPLHTVCAGPSPTNHNFQSPAARISPHFVCPPFDSAERVSVQPAAEFRHVERHKYGQDVSGALRACPAHSFQWKA
eukprot:scaffold36116_cov58-Phaeocystis_antarctica.AAC.2